MTGIACGMRGCTAAIGSTDRHVTVASDGFDRRGFKAATYGGIDVNNIFGATIEEVSCDSDFTPLNTGTTIQLSGARAQNFFSKLELQRANGTFGAMLTAEADIYLILNGGAGPTIWNWDVHMPGLIWEDADLGFVRKVRLTA